MILKILIVKIKLCKIVFVSLHFEKYVLNQQFCHILRFKEYAPFTTKIGYIETSSNYGHVFLKNYYKMWMTVYTYRAFTIGPHLISLSQSLGS